MGHQLNLKLIHKGLLLLSLPLIVQFAFVIFVESTLSSARKERRAIEDSLEVTVRCNDIVGRLVTARTALLLPDNTVFSTQSVLKEDLKSLEATVKDVVDDPEKQRQCNSALSEASKLIESIKSDPVNPAANQQENDKRLMQAQELITSIRTMQPPAAALDLTSLKQKELQIQQVLAFGLVANVVLCPVLVLLFSRDVSSRLSLLVSNSQKLARGEQLIESKTEGEDEIAQLDSVFRNMAKEISDARNTEQQFLSMVSHDLKTPLNSVYGTLTLLSEGVYGELSDTAKQKIEAAENGICRLLLLTNDLLDLERIRTGRIVLNIESKPLKPILESSCQAVSGFAQFKSVTMKCDNTELRVLADEQRLTQVLVNLLSNAIKFSTDGDEVSISVKADGGAVEIAVKDNGPGVADAVQREIFQRFNAQAVTNAGAQTIHGNGLGLSICKAIMDEHKGTIGVKSQVGKGSVFWIRLKLATT